MSARPDLRVINSDGELVQDSELQKLQDEVEGLTLGLRAAKGEVTRLKRELREMHGLEPDHERIVEVLEYCNEVWGRQLWITPGSEGYEKARARLRERIPDLGRALNVDELKKAADGALLDPWMSGRLPKSPGFLAPKYVYKSSDKVQEMLSLAVGFQAKAGVQLGDLLDVATDLQWVKWKFLLEVCGCGHRRVEHARSDPTLEGRELCFFCECPDYDIDPWDPFNIRNDPYLQRWYGPRRKAA